MVDLEDELSDIPSDSVPSEVRNWLASTFTRRKGLAVGCNEDKLRFRSIVHAVQAGIFVDRMYRRSSHMAALSYPPGVVTELKHVDKWSFDVFALNDASGDHSLKFVLYELLTRYDLISRFKVFACPPACLPARLPVSNIVYSTPQTSGPTSGR
ncbi:Calcium/calmodulin-dependent 3',5'-cyclic nucleotide phosphodiesterase 1C [Takifugu flavidus]|uniref:Calcium/calmodulin-dependent 3',5'-cyclic nucleotide phosphodiesterase 1C n=1 Tax=Takifugu flavidus TaxID=433684 RepID=A0A5C6P023_9TELE|nr:Calcium/calmodulin-dependent 3',5'-cyclic nucleotide phosphodiesterase 1C [Takifugu flavidus]